MKNKGEITDVLSELLKINNDRIGIYRQVIRKIGEHDLKIIFQGARFGDVAAVLIGGSLIGGATGLAGWISTPD